MQGVFGRLPALCLVNTAFAAVALTSLVLAVASSMVNLLTVAVSTATASMPAIVALAKFAIAYNVS